MRKAVRPRTIPLSLDHATHGRPRFDLGRDRAWQPAARRTAGNVAAGAARRFGDCRDRRSLVTIYICYHFAKRTIALLGDNGVNVVVRLSAFILLCIGIQVLWTGYSGLVVVR